MGARQGEERTQNMKRMLVTLEVSKLSGWLNADAPCRVGRRVYEAGRGARTRRRKEAWGDGGASGMHGEGPG